MEYQLDPWANTNEDAPQENPFLAKLRACQGQTGVHAIYPCIRDLVQHGLSLARFQPGEAIPQRQDVTQFLATWSRHAGLSEEQTQDWLIEYCQMKLASLSRRSLAAIRHSTKSNIRYIYRSEVGFQCGCASNPFKAECRSDCPFHAEMQTKLATTAGADPSRWPPLPPPPRPQPSPLPTLPFVPIKTRYQEQFEEGMSLARQEASKGTPVARIVAMLNDRGLRTRTGRAWTYGILSSELRKCPG